MTLDDELARLSPERRFSLYNRIADVLREYGAQEASDAARAEAAKAVKQSPKLQAEVQFYLDALKEGT
jgi:hypothetical protein